MATFGELLREHRKRLGWKQHEAAKIAGISENYFVQLELGRRTNPSGKLIERLADALGLSESEKKDLLAAADYVQLPEVGPIRRREHLFKLVENFLAVPSENQQRPGLLGQIIEVLLGGDSTRRDALYAGGYRHSTDETPAIQRGELARTIQELLNVLGGDKIELGDRLSLAKELLDVAHTATRKKDADGAITDKEGRKSSGRRKQPS